MPRRFLTALALLPALAVVAPAPAAEPLSPASLQAKLKASPGAPDLDDEVITMFGGGEANLAKGPNPMVEGTTAAWAIAAKGKPRVVSEDGKFTLDLTRLADTRVYAAAVTLPEGFATRWAFEVDGKTIPHPNANPRQGSKWAQLEVYTEHPDSREQSDVPKGKVTQLPRFRSKVFEGTSRDWWVYVPAQSTGDAPAAVMVFQDGAGYKGFVPTVFDNLIAKKEMPVTVGVFIQPGTFDDGKSNRSFEYDTLSDQYPRFLLEEILPEVEKSQNLKLRRDAAGRAVAGISSGGICAWTVAWERPDEFSKVLSWVGSFTNIASGKTGREGGHNYEAMVRKTPPKKIRVFLQDGARDLDNANGNWPLANQTLAKSLAFAQYDYRFVYGEGFHSNLHGRAILPDSLRWLWRGWESELPR
ncbi:MAG: enterochelin esterase [Planctomycetia bacterium]|nr:enterochelin esterase [Planctomycetia bacterium]